MNIKEWMMLSAGRLRMDGDESLSRQERKKVGDGCVTLILPHMEQHWGEGDRHFFGI